MKPPHHSRSEQHRILTIDAAFRAGDLAALRRAVDDPNAIPNGPMPPAIGSCLHYAIYHSPMPFVRELLEVGADPNHDEAGFTPLLAALSCRKAHPGAPARSDALELIQLLLSFGADPSVHGVNDYTPLHVAVTADDREAAELLLRHGADPLRRTRIDDYESPLDLAVGAQRSELAELLRRHARR